MCSRITSRTTSRVWCGMIWSQSSLRADSAVVWLSHTSSVQPWSGGPKVRLYGTFIGGLRHAQTLQDQQFEDQESEELFLQCLTHVWHRDIRIFARWLEEYSNEAHLSAVKAAFQYSETLVQIQDAKVPDYEGEDEEDELSRLQNPTKAPIISKDFLRALPHCPIIHWASQMKNNPKLCFCPCSNSSQP